jgi:hypothetical protein
MSMMSQWPFVFSSILLVCTIFLLSILELSGLIIPQIPAKG